MWWVRACGVCVRVRCLRAARTLGRVARLVHKQEARSAMGQVCVCVCVCVGVGVGVPRGNTHELASKLRRQARVGVSVVGECAWFETKKSTSYASSVLSSCSTRPVCESALGMAIML